LRLAPDSIVMEPFWPCPSSIWHRMTAPSRPCEPAGRWPKRMI